jgi:hypothetical protein
MQEIPKRINSLPAVERERALIEYRFCQHVLDALVRLEQLRTGNISAELPGRVKTDEESLLAESIHQIPPHVMYISVPPEVNAHTSVDWEPDDEKPTFFIATAIRRWLTEQVEFSETQDDLDNVKGKWLVVFDNYDKLQIDPVLPGNPEYPSQLT